MLAGRLKNYRKGIEDVREGKENALSAIRKELTSIPYLPELGMKSSQLRHFYSSFGTLKEVKPCTQQNYRLVSRPEYNIVFQKFLRRFPLFKVLSI